MGKRQLSKQSLTFLSNEMLHCQLSEAPITPNEWSFVYESSDKYHLFWMGIH